MAGAFEDKKIKEKMNDSGNKLPTRTYMPTQIRRVKKSFYPDTRFTKLSRDTNDRRSQSKDDILGKSLKYFLMQTVPKVPTLVKNFTPTNADTDLQTFGDEIETFRTTNTYRNIPNPIETDRILSDESLVLVMCSLEGKYRTNSKTKIKTATEIGPIR